MKDEMNGSRVSVFDSALYSSLFTQPEMKKIWSENSLIEHWLQFETTIAQVQAALGVIPAQAAIDIEHICQSVELNWDRLAQETKSVGMAIKPLIDQVAEQGTPLVKQYLHWGCTTQDLLDSALAMRVKQTLELIRSQLVELGQQLKLMAIEHKDTVMVARTNSVDASATTWGLQVSSYLGEVSRHIQRLDELKTRASIGVFGGAVGNLASVGTHGLAIRRQVMEKLGLSCPIGMMNASLDHVVEVVQYFALVHGTLCRIANDVETMGRAPIAELAEGEGGGGSSTMPHKTNPRASNMLQTLARMGWMYASGAPSMLDQCDVRSASMRMLNWSVLPESALTLSTSLMRALGLVKHLKVRVERMSENFNASKNFIMSESVMMKVAEKIGREQGYLTVGSLIKQADGSKDLQSLLLSSPDILSILTVAEIKEACLPQYYLGCNEALIVETITLFEKVE